jgi:hypothetical protein
MSGPDVLGGVIAFIRSLGIAVAEREIHRPTLVPGIDIEQGGLIVDPPRLCQPADLLHEAAHIALTPAARRASLDGTISSTPTEEISAIAWTWAAAQHLGVDPEKVFHEEVISGNGPTLLDNFSAGRYVGVPMLQFWGLTQQRDYPRMNRWVRE